MRGTAINVGIQLVTEDCCVCGVLFAFPTTLRQQLADDHSRGFYCPNGHRQFYMGKTDAEKERERVERLDAPTGLSRRRPTQRARIEPCHARPGDQAQEACRQRRMPVLQQVIRQSAPAYDWPAPRLRRCQVKENPAQ